jgi:cell wall-associated NlpC family hydrolase
MKAWAQAGVYLSHYTGYQWGETSRVALGDLRPGDLVFFGSDGPSSHHVGLYVGNGTMIDAPHTGADVQYDNIYSFGGDLLPYGGRP